MRAVRRNGELRDASVSALSILRLRPMLFFSHAIRSSVRWSCAAIYKLCCGALTFLIRIGHLRSVQISCFQICPTLRLTILLLAQMRASSNTIGYISSYIAKPQLLTRSSIVPHSAQCRLPCGLVRQAEATVTYPTTKTYYEL